jgi:hypothetical protein
VCLAVFGHANLLRTQESEVEIEIKNGPETSAIAFEFLGASRIFSDSVTPES